jgi:hypothetical protein
LLNFISKELAKNFLSLKLAKNLAKIFANNLLKISKKLAKKSLYVLLLFLFLKLC